MDTPQGPQQTDGATTDPTDDFAFGSPNRLRLGAIRFTRWLLSPPYLPPALVWFLAALIVSDIAIELLPQPAAYWIDPSTSEYITLLGISFQGGTGYILLMLGYLFIIAILLSVINRKLAFAIWLGLCIYQLGITPEAFRCVAPFYLPFETPANCSTVYLLAILLASLLAGLVVWIAAKLRFIPGFQSVSSTFLSDAGLLKNLGRISFVWIGLCTAAVLVTVAFSPKPTWKPMQVADMPPGRTEAALAYDTQRSVAILFGGTSSWTPAAGWISVNDTWEWNGKDWTEMHPRQRPSPRYASSMAFDEKRNVSVLFGGMQASPDGQNVFYDDTWEWDGTDWHEISPAQRPPARQDAAMFFDPASGTTIVYGGYYTDPSSQETIFFDDAWEWDGKNWQQFPFQELRRNSSAAVVFDPIRQLPLLMDVEGLWSLQDARWVPLSFADNPPGRWNSQMVFKSDSQQIVMFGGFKDKDVFDDTWIYNGKGWEQLITKSSPPRRNGHNMFYDQTRGTVVLFGGLDGGTFYNDMWELVQP